MASDLGLPLGAVLLWPRHALETEIARLLVRRATDDARALVSQETPPDPPSGTELRTQATRAIYARLLAQRRARDDAEQDAALEALL